MSVRSVALVLVGDELLDGRLRDSNGAWLITRLRDCGCRVDGVVIVPDDKDRIVAALRSAAANAALVLVSGGLGPTVDDLTRDALAQLVGEELVEDPQILESIRLRFAARDRALPRGNERQATRPPGAEILENPIGTAPGLWQRFGESVLALMPGVPIELKQMFEEQVMPRIESLGMARATPRVVLRTMGEGESAVAERVHDALGDDGDVHCAFNVHRDGVDVLLAHDDSSRVEAASQKVEAALGRLVYTRGGRALADLLVDRLRARGETVCVAESCTGGMLGARWTEISGSSDVFLGGVIAYDDRIKRALLGVSQEILRTDGAVSEACAAAMARGCRERLDATWALSVTGVAGPTGGSEEKPVGTVWLACANSEAEWTRRLRLPGNREQNRVWSVAHALDLLREAVGQARLDS